jgi:hypothetical protein
MANRPNGKASSSQIVEYNTNQIYLHNTANLTKGREYTFPALFLFEQGIKKIVRKPTASTLCLVLWHSSNG